MKPTDEQIKEFWGWCGFKRGSYIESGMFTGHWHWTDPFGNSLLDLRLPPIDLNNLFKYAVPKLYAFVIQSFNTQHKDLHISIIPNPYKDLSDMPEPISITVSRDEDPALALFWAIYEVMK